MKTIIKGSSEESSAGFKHPDSSELQDLDDSQPHQDPVGKVGRKKRQYVIVPNDKRIQLIIAIQEFRLNCLQASKLLSIPYINAMIIFRTYKSDNKIVSYAKQHKASECYSPFLEEGSFSM